MKALFVFTLVLPLLSSAQIESIPSAYRDVVIQYNNFDIQTNQVGINLPNQKSRIQKAKDWLYGYYEQTTVKERFPALLGSIISGAGYGVNQTLQHHYSYFKNIFPGANDQWWDPRISWINKYKLDSNGDPLRDTEGRRVEAFFLSSSLFVLVTDGFHFTNAFSRVGRQIKAVFYFAESSRQWGYRVIDAIIEFAFESVTFHIVYTGPRLYYQWTR